MSSNSIPESPCNKLPYDLLREVFLRCLSETPLDDDDVQPNPKIAPMLLCHVCSSWRTVALTSASLWSHLYIRLPLLWSQNGQLIIRDSAALERDIDFMKWWRTNQGSVAPFLRIDIHRMSWREEINGQDIYPEPELENFFFDYVSLAYYLDVAAFYPYLIKQRLMKGLSVSFPNLRALVVMSYYARFGDDEDEYIPVIETIPSQIPPTLRRLSIQNERIPTAFNFHKWSALTHVSLDDVGLSLNSWFILIRALVDLQWGHFNFVGLSLNAEKRIQPPKGILPRLSTLSVSVYLEHDDEHEFPISTFFQNLQFPILNTLSLYSSAKTWWDSRAVIEVHNLLKVAPTVRILALGASDLDGGFLCFENDSDLPTLIARNVEPLLKYAPNLWYLQVELRCFNESDVAVLAKDYIKRFFLSRRWLDLANPASHIRKVTIVIKEIPWDVNSEFEEILKALLKWNIRKYIKSETNVSFEIASEAEQGIRNFGSAWETWGSKVWN